MDVIREFLDKQSEPKRHKVSFFFQDYENIITRMLYETVPNLNARELRKFWTTNFEQYHESFICDYNLVDWQQLVMLIRKNIFDNQAEAVVDEALIAKLNDRLRPTDQIDKFFHTDNADIPFGCEIISLRSNFNNARKKLKKTENIREQDYVYYGILDFVTKINEKKTKDLIGDDYSKWADSLVKRATQPSNALNFSDKAYQYCKDVLMEVRGANSKAKEKIARSQLKKNDDDFKLKKKCVELIKLQRHRLTDEMHDENEYTFIINYFSKILTLLCIFRKDTWKLQWGEKKLAASKEEENLAKNDDDKRSVGSSIDAILASKEVGVEFTLLEVSGAMSKEDYDHFLKDRLKIAKNLKYVFKSILRRKLVVSDATQIKLYGIQVYRNTVFVYAMLMPVLNIFCFVEAFSFKIPASKATYPTDTPRFIKNIFKMLSFVDNADATLQSYLIVHDDYNTDESYSDKDASLTPPYVSPQKASQKRKEKASSSEPTTSKKQKQRQ